MKSAIVNCGLFVEIRTKLVSVVAALDDSVADKIPPCIHHHRHQLHQNTSTDYTFGSPLQIPNSRLFFYQAITLFNIKNIMLGSTFFAINLMKLNYSAINYVAEKDLIRLLPLKVILDWCKF